MTDAITRLLLALLARRLTRRRRQSRDELLRMVRETVGRFRYVCHMCGGQGGRVKHGVRCTHCLTWLPSESRTATFNHAEFVDVVATLALLTATAGRRSPLAVALFGLGRERKPEKDPYADGNHFADECVRAGRGGGS